MVELRVYFDRHEWNVMVPRAETHRIVGQQCSARRYSSWGWTGLTNCIRSDCNEYRWPSTSMFVEHHTIRDELSCIPSYEEWSWDDYYDELYLVESWADAPDIYAEVQQWQMRQCSRTRLWQKRRSRRSARTASGCRWTTWIRAPPRL